MLVLGVVSELRVIVQAIRLRVAPFAAQMLPALVGSCQLRRRWALIHKVEAVLYAGLKRAISLCRTGRAVAKERLSLVKKAVVRLCGCTSLCALRCNVFERAVAAVSLLLR